MSPGGVGLAVSSAGVLCLAAMSAFSVVSARHHQDWTGRELPTRVARWLWRGLGSLGLVLAWSVLWRVWGGTVSLVLGLGLLSGAAIVVALALSYRPQAWRGALPWLATAGLLMWVVAIWRA